MNSSVLQLTIHGYSCLAGSEESLEVQVESMEKLGWTKVGPVQIFYTKECRIICQTMISAVGIPAIEGSPRLLLKGDK